jgi:NAD(P)-dependent dehydrogenase (short-subunit alcohol dehydrogenase family)
MSSDFTGKVAIVAGCARPPGMGYATALRLAKHGATLVCVDAVGAQPEGGYDTGIVSEALLDEVTAEVAAAAVAPVVSVAADPYDQSSWERAVAVAVEHFGRIDICCALMGTTGPAAGDGNLIDLPLDSWQRCYDVNVVAPLLLSRACARAMVAPHAIRVNAVQPLSVRSDDDRFPNPGLQRLADHEADSFSTWVHSQVPLGRPQRADETAAAVEFLCSDESSFITGVSLAVAGGAHSHS